jgi:hypothetical protein
MAGVRFDWSEQQIRAMEREAESRGEARGRAAVLAEVAKLPSPWDEDIAAADPETVPRPCRN